MLRGHKFHRRLIFGSSPAKVQPKAERHTRRDSKSGVITTHYVKRFFQETYEQPATPPALLSTLLVAPSLRLRAQHLRLMARYDAGLLNAEEQLELWNLSTPPEKGKDLDSDMKGIYLLGDLAAEQAATRASEAGSESSTSTGLQDEAIN